MTLVGNGESFRFKGFAYVRLAPDKVDASGELLAMKVKVSGKPKLVVNGKVRSAEISEGVLTFAD